LWEIIDAFVEIIFSVIGILYLIKDKSFDKFFGIFFMILGISYIISSLKKHKKTI